MLHLLGAPSCDSSDFKRSFSSPCHISLLVSFLVCLFVWAYSNADSAAAASMKKSNLRFFYSYHSSSVSATAVFTPISCPFSTRLEIISAPARRSPSFPFSSAAAPFPFPNFFILLFFLQLFNQFMGMGGCVYRFLRFLRYLFIFNFYLFAFVFSASFFFCFVFDKSI